MSERLPVVTYALAAGILVVAWRVTGFVPTEASLLPVAWSRDAFAAGDWGRLIVSVFAHGGPVHLALNLLALLSFGAVVERAVGHAGMLALFLAGGVAGNLAHVLFGPDVPVVGASGAIFGLLGILLVFAPLAQVALLGVVPMPILLASALYVASVPVLSSLSDVLPIAHEAHLGGMALGFVSGLLLRPGRGWRVLPAAAAVFGAAWFGVAYAVALDYDALVAADALGVLLVVWPLAATVAVIGAAFAYLARLDASPEAAA